MNRSAPECPARAWARRNRASEDRTGPVVASTEPSRSSITNAASWSASQRSAASAIKLIDSKRALKGFTGSRNPDKPDQIPEDSETAQPEENYFFRGHFLDLRTLAFALTDRGHTLESACEAFGVEHGKQAPDPPRRGYRGVHRLQPS